VTITSSTLPAALASAAAAFEAMQAVSAIMLALM
jgi:hypothetical protein